MNPLTLILFAVAAVFIFFVALADNSIDRGAAAFGALLVIILAIFIEVLAHAHYR